MIHQNINIYELKAVLAANSDSPLIFNLDEQTIHPGYHVTEVKHAVINSLDCGSGKDQWDEIIVQLLDGNANFEHGYMNCGKFMGIVSKAIESVSFDENTLTFVEFAPDNGALRKLAIDSIKQENNQIIIELSNQSAVCKPFQRTMAGGTLTKADAANESAKPTCC